MSKTKTEAFETFEIDLPPIRGFPELRWAGKRPFTSTQYFPAQKKEAYGDPKDGWWNRLYWGDNLQVMSHLLREFRGKVDLIYIDPPFDSKADYLLKVSLRGVEVASDYTSFEEKQYTDMWSNDDYLQFMYERLHLLRELCSDNGYVIVHCDSKRSHHLRSMMDEVFGPDRFVNEIIWHYRKWSTKIRAFQRNHDNLLCYCKSAEKSDERTFNQLEYEPPSQGTLRRWGGKKQQARFDDSGRRTAHDTEEDSQGSPLSDVWEGESADATPDVLKISIINPAARERVGYPTQKPEALLARLIRAFSGKGDLIFDGFMGSGTTQAVAMKLGRRFIGADINLGAVEKTIARINNVRDELRSGQNDLFDASLDGTVAEASGGFEVYNVNNYDFFRNPVEAKELIKDAMELQPMASDSIFDGQRDQHLVKIMPVNRIATRQDLNEIINGLDFKAFERRAAESPSKPVERIHLVCMGHEPDLAAELQKAAKPFDIEVLVTDLIRDKAHLHFKRASEARLAIEDGYLVVTGFFPMNLLQKLSMEADAVEDWRQLVESIKVDWNYDGAILSPSIVDSPDKDGLVTGRYSIPADAATIRVKITDLLSESWEGEIENG
ncbi:site-specific DNA-methyltransferase [Hyphomicrobium sp. MC8b]|uniref:site-specific DNA-methyltransferase n=1 Tax=Hyphomicrobium sp. MC8b TaxID=300273 RepID=UPI00391A553F